jgi:ribosome-associated protein
MHAPPSTWRTTLSAIGDFKGEGTIDAVTLARRAVAAAEDKQATEIMLLDLRSLTTIADYFVICTVDNERQLRAVMRAIDEELTGAGAKNPRIEGSPETGWVLIDFVDVVVHLFSPEQREFYRLERLWKQAQPIVVVQ